MPELLRPGQPGSRGTFQRSAPRGYRELRIQPDDLWRLAAPSARSELQGTSFGNQEMEKMWQRMRGILPVDLQQYLDEVDAAIARGDAYIIAAMAHCLYEPIYRTAAH